jgi:hypothetical protein
MQQCRASDGVVSGQNCAAAVFVGDYHVGSMLSSSTLIQGGLLVWVVRKGLASGDRAWCYAAVSLCHRLCVICGLLLR